MKQYLSKKDCNHLCSSCMHRCKCEAVVLCCYRYIPSTCLRQCKQRRFSLQKERRHYE